MRIFPKLILLAVCYPVIATSLAAAQSDADDFYRQWVEYKNGEVSLAFNQTPVDFAIYAIHAKTGFQIVIPPTLQAKVVNLRLERQPLEPAVRSLIATIGYKNFAMLYDDAGRPNSAIVVNASPVAPSASAASKAESTIRPLSKEERESLQKDLEQWNDLGRDERRRIEDRLKTLPESQEREELVKLYGQQLLGIAKPNEERKDRDLVSLNTRPLSSP